MEQLSASEVRRLFLWSQGLVGSTAGTGPARMLRRMGVVQLDTISVLARSHELVQYARLGPVPRRDIEEAYWQRPPVAFEYLAHAFCIIPIEDWPWMTYRHRGRWTVTLEAARRSPTHRLVLDRLAEGPATATELGGAKRGGVWWDWSDVKQAAETLLRSGHVVCIERRGWRRVYDLADRVIPPDLLSVRPTVHDCHVELVRRAARHLAVATRGDLADYYRLGKLEVEAVLGDAGLVPVDVRGWSEPAWADPAALDSLREGRVRGRHRTAMLSPFDPVVWDRVRTARLFGFSHRLEAYVPAADRVHGYFAMPVLSGGRLVGRVDPARSGRTFVARSVGIESPRDVPAIAAAIVEAAAWVGSTAIAVERVEPAAGLPALRKALSASGA